MVRHINLMTSPSPETISRGGVNVTYRKANFFPQSNPAQMAAHYQEHCRRTNTMNRNVTTWVYERILRDVMRKEGCAYLMPLTGDHNVCKKCKMLEEATRDERRRELAHQLLGGGGEPGGGGGGEPGSSGDVGGDGEPGGGGGGGGEPGSSGNVGDEVGGGDVGGGCEAGDDDYLKTNAVLFAAGVNASLQMETATQPAAGGGALPPSVQLSNAAGKRRVQQRKPRDEGGGSEVGSGELGGSEVGSGELGGSKVSGGEVGGGEASDDDLLTAYVSGTSRAALATSKQRRLQDANNIRMQAELLAAGEGEVLPHGQCPCDVLTTWVRCPQCVAHEHETRRSHSFRSGLWFMGGDLVRCSKCRTARCTSGRCQVFHDTPDDGVQWAIANGHGQLLGLSAPAVAHEGDGDNPQQGHESELGAASLYDDYDFEFDDFAEAGAAADQRGCSPSVAASPTPSTATDGAPPVAADAAPPVPSHATRLAACVAAEKAHQVEVTSGIRYIEGLAAEVNRLWRDAAHNNGGELPVGEPRTLDAPHFLVIDDKRSADLPSVPLNTTERAAFSLHVQGIINVGIGTASVTSTDIGAGPKNAAHEIDQELMVPPLPPTPLSALGWCISPCLIPVPICTMPLSLYCAAPNHTQPWLQARPHRA